MRSAKHALMIGANFIPTPNSRPRSGGLNSHFNDNKGLGLFATKAPTFGGKWLFQAKKLRT
jgi:hypothetical protein